MLDAAIVARIKEIIGDNRCGCGEKADRFRQTQKAGISYHCNSCYARLIAESTPQAFLSGHRVEFSQHPIDDPDNMPDLFWAPPIAPRKRRIVAKSA